MKLKLFWKIFGKNKNSSEAVWSHIFVVSSCMWKHMDSFINSFKFEGSPKKSFGITSCEALREAAQLCQTRSKWHTTLILFESNETSREIACEGGIKEAGYCVLGNDQTRSHWAPRWRAWWPGQYTKYMRNLERLNLLWDTFQC